MRYCLKIILLLGAVAFQTTPLYSAVAGLGAKEPTHQEKERFLEAGRSGDLETIRAMIAQYPGIANKRRFGATLFNHMIGPKTPDIIISELIKAGADLNIVDDSGNTALSQAAYWGLLAQTKMLLLAGADPNAGTIKRAKIRHKKRRQAVDQLHRLGLPSSDIALHDRRIAAEKSTMEKTINTAMQEINKERKALSVDSLQAWPSDVAKIMADYAATPSHTE